MRKLSVALIATVWLSFLNHSRAQETNALPLLYTRLEVFEARINTVIVKGTAPVGTVAVTDGTVSVWAKESQDVTSGQKEYGLAVGIKAGNGNEDVTVLDDDELDSFLAGIDFIAGVNIQVTPLPSFYASYTSKGTLKIAAYTSTKRVGTIQAALQSVHTYKARVLLAQDQLVKFKILIEEAKAKLDALKKL